MDDAEEEFLPPLGWKMSRDEWDYLVNLSYIEIDEETGLVHTAILPSVGLPTPRNDEAINTANQSFDTESMVDFYALGSSFPLYPAVNPSI